MSRCCPRAEHVGTDAARWEGETWTNYIAGPTMNFRFAISTCANRHEA
jgi:hypothetical protein